MSSNSIPRRKLLTIVGGVGAGAVIGGGSTWSLLQDEETFANNQLVMGELDLKAVWQQTYNGDPVNAFPDSNGDGLQDEIQSRQEIATDAGLPVDSPSVETAFREQFADMPDDVDAPVINLRDVKAGDEGSLSLGLHLFDNPGTVMLQGSLLESLERGTNEAERDHRDYHPGREGELADVVQAEIVNGNGNTLAAGSLRTVLLSLFACGLPTGPLPNSTTREFEFKWRVPQEVEYGVQTDSVAFDLSFFSEQLRNNSSQVATETGGQSDGGSHLKIAKKVRRVKTVKAEPASDKNDGKYQDKIPAKTAGGTIGLAQFRIDVKNTSDSDDDWLCVTTDFNPNDGGEDIYVDDPDNEQGCLEMPDMKAGPIVVEGVTKNSNIKGPRWPTGMAPSGGEPHFEEDNNIRLVDIEPFKSGEIYRLKVLFKINPNQCDDVTITCTTTAQSSRGPKHQVQDKASVKFK